VRRFVRHVLALARAEVLHVVRDRATSAQLLVIPIVQLLVLSNAATFAIRQSPLYVVDLDGGSVSRGLVNRLRASGLFAVVGQSSSPGAADEAMLHGQVTLVLTIPRGFESRLTRERVAPVHLDVNAEKGSAAGIVQSYAVRIIEDHARELDAQIRPVMRSVVTAPAREGAPPRAQGRVETVGRMRYNPTLNYRHFMVPGILVALVTMIGTEARFSSARRRATSSQPVITGIIRSVTTTIGGGPSVRCRKASAPFAAVRTS